MLLITMNQWRSELEDELRTNILGFWIRHTIDENNGGFVGEIKSDMTIVHETDKGLVLHARILWSFAAAYRFYKDKAYLTMAKRAYKALDQMFRDHES